MKTTEVLTKGLFYFALPALVVFNDSLGKMETFEWDIEAVRGLLLVPLITGLNGLKAFFSSTYANYRDGEEKEGAKS